MNDLNRLRVARANLDHQIREAEAEAAGTFNFSLDRLSDAVYEHAERNGIEWADDSRKNWTTLVLDERLTVKFGEQSEAYGRGGLVVTAGGMTAEFDPLPTAEALTGLIDFLLAQVDREH